MKKYPFFFALFFAISALCSCGNKSENTESDAQEVNNNLTEIMSDAGLSKKELTEADAEHFVNFLALARKKSPEWEAKYNDNPASAIAALLTGNADFEQALQEAGFKDRQEFYAVVTRISQVMVSYNNKVTNTEVQGGKDKAMEEFDKQLQNPELDENTKKVLEEQRETLKKSLEEFDKTSEEIAGDVTEKEREILKKILPKIDEQQ
jgi:hypothetical protein